MEEYYVVHFSIGNDIEFDERVITQTFDTEEEAINFYTLMREGVASDKYEWVFEIIRYTDSEAQVITREILEKRLCDKNNKQIKELIEAGTDEQINEFKCTLCADCKKLNETGCDGLAWLDNILETK